MASPVLTNRGRVVAYGALALLLIGAVCLTLIPTKATLREPQFRAICRKNLLEIGSALRRYHEDHGSFPPQYVIDKDGHPLYSWRVLLLPYLEMVPLYEQLHLDEPWNSGHNRPLLDRRLPFDMFWCPSDSKADRSFTSYVAVVHHPGERPLPLGSSGAHVGDDAERIMVVEIVDSTIHWAEPADLDAEKAALGVNRRKDGIGSKHPGGANALFSNGDVRFLEEECKIKVNAEPDARRGNGGA